MKVITVTPDPDPILAPFSAECADDTAPTSAVRQRSGTKSLAVERDRAETTAICRPAADVADEAPANRDKLVRRTTPMEARGRGFEKTKWSLVLRAGAASPEALRELCEAYRAPLQAFARRIEFDPERADDVVQGFLTRILEQKVVDKADPARGSFRSFLRQAMRNYAINVHRAEARWASFDELDSDRHASKALAADRLFDQACARALVDRALARLRAEQRIRADKGAVFEALSERLEGDDDGTTLIEAARKLGKNEGALKVALFRLRRRYFDLVRAEAAPTVEHPEDIDAELRALRAALRGDE
jgi:RNA polymerase sigma factor (sigma-70 family)